MADAPAPEPSSTPTATPAEPAVVADAPPPAKVAEAHKAAEPQKGSEPAPAEPAKAVEPEPAKDVPLFTLPEDFKAPEAMVSKFTEFAKTLADPKQAQGVADLYVGLARDANTAWQKQIESVDRSNLETCKRVFNAEELAAAETAVGFFSTYNPGFRDFAKRQLNDPLFTLVMRYVGEQLSEDAIGNPSLPTKPTDTRPLRERAAEALGYSRKAS